MARLTTIGKEEIRGILPEDMREYSNIMWDGKTTNKFFDELADKHPKKYIDVLYKLSRLGGRVSREYGREASLKLSDIRPPAEVREMQSVAKQRVNRIIQDPHLSKEDKNKKVTEYILSIQDDLRAKTLEAAAKAGNSLAIAAKNGIRGNPLQLSQILLGDLLVADHKGNAVPVAALKGYGEGISPILAWVGAAASRKGYYDVQFATAQTGFGGKKIANAAMDVIVKEEDCGADSHGIPVTGEDYDIIGKVLAEDTAGFEKGHVISKRDINDLSDEEFIVRSPNTCQTGDGVCQKCSGKRRGRGYPEIGAYVGLESASAVSEPLTQMGLSSKHSGGVKGVNDQHIAGFNEVMQFIDVPKGFDGAAVSEVSGKVDSVEEAPQGGNYVTVSGKKYYVGPDREVTVEPGKEINAGDVLSDGYPNPALIARYKGLGEGRRYFVRQFRKIMKKNGVYTHRSNVENIARGMMNRITITDPDFEQDGRIVGDIMDYSRFQKTYKPREGTQELEPRQAQGMYLEKPILHYSIGTPITAKTVEYLNKKGIQRVPVHKGLPVFEPLVERPQTASSKSNDFKKNMVGWGVKSSFLRDVQNGSSSPRDGIVSQIFNPADM